MALLAIFLDGFPSDRGPENFMSAAARSEVSPGEGKDGPSRDDALMISVDREFQWPAAPPNASEFAIIFGGQMKVIVLPSSGIFWNIRGLLVPDNDLIS